MQTEVHKLAELLRTADVSASEKGITDYKEALVENAEYLLDKGVLVPPCKVGDKFYSVLEEFGDWSVEESEIIGICIENGEWYVESKDGEFWKVGTDLCLLDKADAERVLKERASVKKN